MIYRNVSTLELKCAEVGLIDPPAFVAQKRQQQEPCKCVCGRLQIVGLGYIRIVMFFIAFQIPLIDNIVHDLIKDFIVYWKRLGFSLNRGLG